MAMRPTLDYAPVTRRARSVRPALVGVAVLVAVAAAGYAVYGAVEAAGTYLGSFGGCAWGRMEAKCQLTVVSPIACTFSGMGWMVARHEGAGVLLCRGATWVGIAGWLTACACAFAR